MRQNRGFSARRRAAGDEAAARRAEARLADHMARLQRYGRLLIAFGGVLLAASLIVVAVAGVRP